MGGGGNIRRIVRHAAWAEVVAASVLRDIAAADYLKTVVWVPTLAARGALVRAFAAAGHRGILPRIIVPMQDSVAMRAFGIGPAMWPREADVLAARQHIGRALAEAEHALGGSVLARQTETVLDLLEELALAGQPRAALWESVHPQLAAHWLAYARLLQLAVQTYETWLKNGGTDIAALPAARWQKLGALAGWRQVIVSGGWQHKVVLDWVARVAAGEGNMIFVWEDGTPRESGPERVVVEASNPVEEARAVRLAAQEAVARGDVPVAVAVGDAALGSLIGTELASVGLTPKGGWQRTVSETVLGRTALALLRAVAEPNGVALAAWAHAWGNLANSNMRPALELLEEKVWRGAGAGSWVEWMRLARRHADAATVVQAWEDTGVTKAPRETSIAAWAAWLLGVLDGTRADWRELEGGKAIDEVLRHWQEAEALWLVPASVAHGWLRQAMERAVIARPVPATAPVLTGRMAALAGAKTLIVAGVNTDQWIPTRSHPWLSEGQLRKLGIPGRMAAEALATEEWHHLWQGAGAVRVVVTRSVHGCDGTEAAPAAPWLALRDTTPPAVWQTWKDAGQPYLAWQRSAVHGSPPAPAALPMAPVEVWSPSMVEAALSCPYRAAITRRSEVRAWEDFDALPDSPRKFGNLCHDVIRDFWAAWPQDMVDAGKEDDALGALRTLMDAALARSEPALANMWRPRVAALLPDLVRQWVQDAAEGWRVAGVEVPLEGMIGDVRVGAKADRLDTRGGIFRVVDYKTGAVPDKNKLANGGKPQLLLEAALLQARGQPTESVLYVRLRGFGKNMLEISPFGEKDLGAWLTAVPDGLSRLAGSLGEGKPWHAVPDLAKGGLEPSGHCATCTLAGWCRFEEARREAAV